LPDPRRTQSERLFDRLVVARAALVERRLEPACGDVSEVGSRLSGEPGLTELRDVWPSLRTASDALVAVCGQATLLEQPFDPTPATLQARTRWHNGLEQELQTACDALKRSATELGRRLDC